jgi:hypothetical protein
VGARDSFNGHHSCRLQSSYAWLVPIDVDDDVDVDVIRNLVQVIRFKE